MTNTHEIERTILGCFLYYPEQFADKISFLQLDCFTSEPRRTIFKALEDCYSENGAGYDSTLVSSHITNPQLCESELTSCILSGANANTNIDKHIRVLMENAKLRFVKTKTQSLMNTVDLSPKLLRHIADEAESAFSFSYAATSNDVYDRYIDEIDKPKDLLYTRYSQLDNLMGGIQEGTLTIIGARPSVGKTTFALNIAQNIAELGRKVYFFSLEMTDHAIINKLVSRGCNFDYKDIQKKVTPEQREIIREYLCSKGINEKLYPIADVNTVESICSMILIDKPDVAVVDYAQIVRTSDHDNSDPRIRIDYISAELKSAAKRSGTRVILLSQLRRPEPGKSKKYHAPSMADLKESSGLEQDADYVLLISRPFVELAKSSTNTYKPSESYITVEKNRYGIQGRVSMFFDGAHQSFNKIG